MPKPKYEITIQQNNKFGMRQYRNLEAAVAAAREAEAEGASVVVWRVEGRGSVQVPRSEWE